MLDKELEQRVYKKFLAKFKNFQRNLQVVTLDA
jgi:hypothetical protein